MTYEPGTVAVVTWGDKSARAIFTRDGHWSLDTAWSLCLDASVPTDVRPLVVLDLPADDLITVAATLREYGQTPANMRAVGQIEAQTKPPRIPEPLDTGSIVCATRGLLWCRADDGSWVCLSDGYAGDMTAWPNLVDPVLFRDGIEESS